VLVGFASAVASSQVRGQACAVGSEQCSELAIRPADRLCTFSRKSTATLQGQNPWTYLYVHGIFGQSSVANTDLHAEYKSTVDPSNFISVTTRNADTNCHLLGSVGFKSNLAPIEDPSTFTASCGAVSGGLPGTTICAPHSPCPPSDDDDPGEMIPPDPGYEFVFESKFIPASHLILYTATNQSPQPLQFDWIGLQGIASFSGTLMPAQTRVIQVPAVVVRETVTELRATFGNPGATQIRGGVATVVPSGGGGGGGQVPAVGRLGLVSAALVLVLVAWSVSWRRRSSEGGS
jgi:hypothetical protein